MPRSNQTKQLLAQSLQELMATTPLEKISVNDIVDHANVGRNTFYYHFEDKYDLVNWYFQSGITRFLVELSAYSSWNALLAALEAGQYAGLLLQLSAEQRALLVSDARGDSMDAVLCLLQAAWALQQHQQGAPLYGLPPDMDPLEGWIVGA